MDELAQRFAALTDKYGPHVVESGLTAARISGLTNVAIGIMWLLLCAAACGCGWYMYLKTTNNSWTIMTGKEASVLWRSLLLVSSR